jgi:hypothetical protein
MVKAPTCAIGVEFALALKHLNPAIGKEFRCVRCGKLVDAHEAGKGSPARFEHRKRNPKCELSDKARSSAARDTSTALEA